MRLDTATTVRAIFERADDTAPSSYTRYLAEGAASDFFDTRLVLANPGGRTAHASVQFLREDGVVVPHVAQVAPLSSARVEAGQFAELAGRAFATIVESDTPLVIDRTMSWHAPGGVAYGAHAETSVAGPAPRWYLAEGATHAGFDLFYLLLNPHDRTVSARIRYLRPIGEALEKTYQLPPRSRTSVWVDQEVFDATGAQALNNTEVSAIVETLDGAGIVVERAMYDSRQGITFAAGHESAGVTAPATRWYFAEGATGPFFDLFLLIANPGDRATDVQVTYLLPDGTRERRRASCRSLAALHDLGGPGGWRACRHGGVRHRGVGGRRADRRGTVDVVARRLANVDRGAQLARCHGGGHALGGGRRRGLHRR